MVVRNTSYPLPRSSTQSVEERVVIQAAGHTIPLLPRCGWRKGLGEGGILFLLLLLLPLSAAYADNTQQGAAAYDWQTCVSNRFGDCMNGCQFNNSLDCQSDCKTTAQDKCKTEGLVPTDEP